MSSSDRTWARIRKMQQADRRRWLYANDPIWRLTKLKDNWERRERSRRGVA